MGALLSAAALGAESKPQAPAADAESQLAAARARLEQAAREVAELSAQMAEENGGRYFAYRFDAPRAIIGLQLDEANPKEGARVREVSPGGPAADAGVRAGDVIVAIDGAPVTGENSARQVIERMRHVEPNSKVKLRVLRSGTPKDIEVTARAAPAFSFRYGAAPAAPAVPAPPPGFSVGPEGFGDFGYLRQLNGEIAGMELATLTPRLGQYFGTDRGVLVVRAPESGTFQLQDGDVILAIDGREPKNGSHATRILRSYQPGEKIAMKIVRQKKSMSLQVTLPEIPETRSRYRGFRGSPTPPAAPAPPAPRGDESHA
jgi:S1-C subfamily serine protease